MYNKQKPGCLPDSLNIEYSWTEIPSLVSLARHHKYQCAPTIDIMNYDIQAIMYSYVSAVTFDLIDSQHDQMVH